MMARKFPLRCFASFNSSKNYYLTLGLASTASQPDIKKAYHDLARVYHPDSKTGNENKFKEIAEAFEVLSDDKLRLEYDTSRLKPATPKPNIYDQPFSQRSTFRSSNFQQMSEEEKIRRARERFAKWKEGKPKFYKEATGEESRAWSGGQSRTRSPKYYAADEARPLDAFSWFFGSIVILSSISMVIWCFRILHRVMNLPQARIEYDEQPVFKPTRMAERSTNKSEKPADPVLPAKVTRNKFPGSSPSV